VPRWRRAREWKAGQRWTIRRYELSEAARDSARRRVLQEQGLTPDLLERQARRYGDNPARATAIWTAINRKMLRLQRDRNAEGDAERKEEKTR
jgi:hypothetical protein